MQRGTLYCQMDPLAATSLAASPPQLGLLSIRGAKSIKPLKPSWLGLAAYTATHVLAHGRNTHRDVLRPVHSNSMRHCLPRREVTHWQWQHHALSQSMCRQDNSAGAPLCGPPSGTWHVRLGCPRASQLSQNMSDGSQSDRVNWVSTSHLN